MENPFPKPLRTNLLSLGELTSSIQQRTRTQASLHSACVGLPQSPACDDCFVQPAQHYGWAVLVITASSMRQGRAVLQPSDNFWAGKLLRSPGKGSSINENSYNNYVTSAHLSNWHVCKGSHRIHGDLVLSLGLLDRQELDGAN